MSVVLAVGVGAKTGAALVAAGCCLGVGFWLSKKITNKIDEKLCLYDKRALARLEREMDLDQASC